MRAVMIPADPRVGVPANTVLERMTRLSASIRDGIAILDRQVPITTKDHKRILFFICSVFVNFLTVHPYLNGNGHAARVILWCILRRYGFWPLWQIDVHPPDPPYSELISRYRSGEKGPLEQYVLQWLV
jgi:hypothetical protein